MYGLIIKRKPTDRYFTNLKEVFDVLGGIAISYNWLLSDYDCNIYPSSKIQRNEQYVWLDGAEFSDILEEHTIQFIWGVATAYSKYITPEEVLQYPLPLAEEYEGFWDPEITMQNPLADIEVVPWDSTFLLIISKSREIIERFARKYPDSCDLAEYNRKS